MPRSFEQCVKGGGRIRRVTGPNKDHGLAEGEYVNYCYKGGKSYRGEVKQAQKGSKPAERAYARKAKAKGW